MNEYVPNTEHVRDAYVRAMRNAFIASAGEHEAEFDRWLERVRAEERAEERAKFIDWLIETVHYPFDVTYDVPPPIDIDALADRWNEVDGWHVSAEEARACVREEAAIRALSEQDTERSAE